MSIKQLKKIIPAPEYAVEANDHNWNRIVDQCKTDFPSDYKKFLSTYGTGSIGEFLWIINPFSNNNNLNLEKIFYFQNSYQNLRRDFPSYYTREKETFLPWGFTDNGDCVFWLVEGESPNSWPVGIQAADPSSEELTKLTMSEFLEVLVRKQLTSTILPVQFLESDKFFVSIK